MLKHSLFLGAFLALGSVAQAAETGDWITTWAASPQPIWTPDFFAPVKVPRTSGTSRCAKSRRSASAGKQVRLVISNLYGTTPLELGAAHVALAGANESTEGGSDHAVTFDGKPGITVPPGAEWISDPVNFAVPPLSKLAVSLYFPGVVPVTTSHWEGRDTAYISEGNTVADSSINHG